MKIITLDKNPSVVNFTHCYGINGMPIDRISHNENVAKSDCREAEATCSNDVIWTEKEHKAEFEYRSKIVSITIPKGFLSDGASLPVKMQWVVTRNHRIVYLFHDFVYYYPDLVRAELEKQGIYLNKRDTRKFADKLMLNMLRYVDGNVYNPRQLTYPILRVAGRTALKNNMKLRGLEDYA